MNKYINRETTLMIIDNYAKTIECDEAKTIVKTVRDIVAVIVPTAGVQEIKHGKWKRYDETNAVYCSYCGKPATNKKEMSWHSYCPICGCKMDS